MDAMIPSIGAALAGAMIVYSIDRLWNVPEWLLLGAFLIGILGLLLIAVPPWPTLGERLVWAAMGGMVGSAVIWYQRRRRSRRSIACGVPPDLCGAQPVLAGVGGSGVIVANAG